MSNMMGLTLKIEAYFDGNSVENIFEKLWVKC